MINNHLHSSVHGAGNPGAPGGPIGPGGPGGPACVETYVIKANKQAAIKTFMMRGF